MPLFGKKNSKPDDTPFLAPEPEGPDEISARTERPTKGRSNAAKRWLLEKSSLGVYPPAKRFLISTLATTELTMMALDLFTDANLPAGWLLGAVPSSPSSSTKTTRKRTNRPPRNRVITHARAKPHPSFSIA